jgi:putative proteasome-type protease
MTYCVAAVTDHGIVFGSDSRTHAGVDQLGIFCKMTVVEAPEDRVIVLLAAGNLASTQSVISLLKLRMRDEDGVINPHGMLGLRSLFDVAALVGTTMREVSTRDGPMLMQQNIDPGCTFILGGQIRGKQQRLFLIYPQGNFIESSRDTNYFQIGESKYGKPVIDRVLHYETSLKDVAKCLLVSFNSTMRSNLSVGPPIDLLIYENNTLNAAKRRRFSENDPYLNGIGQFWSAGLRRVFTEAPDVPWD